MPQALELAKEHHKNGRSVEAQAIYQQILAVDPNYFDAMHLLGVLMDETHPDDLGVLLIRKALTLQPDNDYALQNLGYILMKRGDLQSAIQLLNRAVEIKPDYFRAYNNLALAYEKTKQFELAEATYRQALKVQPDFPDTMNNLANALMELKKFDEALVVYRRASELMPADAEILSNVGNALKKLRQYDEAETIHRRALAMNPDSPPVLNNLASVMEVLKRADEAERLYRRAIEVRPDYGPAHWNLSSILLRRGDLIEGFKEFEWRDLWTGVDSSRKFPKPTWDGSNLRGKRILVHAEQGLGDSLQFIRFIPQVVSRGGVVIVEIQPALRQLLSNYPGISEIVSYGEALPEYDVQIKLTSLPLALGTTLENCNPRSPYLHAPADAIERWRNRLAEFSDRKLNVGLAWAGNPQHFKDFNRSIKLSTYAPLAAVTGVRFFSLQKGPAGDQAANPPAGMELIDWTAELTDFTETAGLVQNLDLLISIDSAIVHLSGAMAKPAWVLIANLPDWRWLLNVSESPWYPTVRLYRQIRECDWSDPIAAIATDLASLANRG